MLGPEESLFYEARVGAHSTTTQHGWEGAHDRGPLVELAFGKRVYRIVEQSITASVIRGSDRIAVQDLDGVFDVSFTMVHVGARVRFIGPKATRLQAFIGTGLGAMFQRTVWIDDRVSWRNMFAVEGFFGFQYTLTAEVALTLTAGVVAANPTDFTYGVGSTRGTAGVALYY